ncbi:MAG: hypothetical protein ACFE9V_18770 [Candidatus Hodarchaeota archaeon]
MIEADKESIIRKLKENKKLILIFALVFTSGLIIGISISTIDLSKPKRYYIAIDDIEIRGGTDPFSSSVKIAYDYDSVPIGEGRGFLMRFDLRNKPKRWLKCEISLYTYFGGATGSSDVYLFEGNWTEEEWDGYGNYMGDVEIYWKFDNSVSEINTFTIGFDFIDISDYITNITTPTFSIAVMGEGGFSKLYSSEWNNTGDNMLPFVLTDGDTYKNYLPQLIWT